MVGTLSTLIGLDPLDSCDKLIKNLEFNVSQTRKNMCIKIYLTVEVNLKKADQNEANKKIYKTMIIVSSRG